jgi:hypothetical protein
MMHFKSDQSLENGTALKKVPPASAGAGSGKARED